MAGQPKTAFFVVLGLVIVAFVGFAVYRSDLLAPKGGDGNKPDVSSTPPPGKSDPKAGTQPISSWPGLPASNCQRSNGRCCGRRTP